MNELDKSVLKKFAIEARRELLEKVKLQARKLGITAELIQDVSVESSDAVFIEGRQLLDTERKQRNKLIARINDIGFDRVMDETAYTWFNRFIALRYMEVNEYLPTKVRVLSSNLDGAEPDMMKEALSLNLTLDKEYVYNLKLNNKTDELFKYLIKLHCNDLNRYMPFMFENIEGYSEILFPEGLLGTDSFLRKMINTQVIPEKYWEKVEIIGWLYQYYISEENERVIQAKKRYKAEEIPFATQLFTPEWIVRYMVQNALGRYWIESHPEHRSLIENWEFYIENSNPEVDFQEELALYINKELNVEAIKCFDPAMGSGHILVYMFDVLYEIYIKCGYMEREIPRLIIENNLYGLDIDDRAYQLASFSVVMKALQHNKRFLRNIERDGLTINLASIQETNAWSDEEVAFLAGESSGEQFDKMKAYIEQFKHAKAIGSLIKIESQGVDFLQKRLLAIEQQNVNLFELDMKNRTLSLFKKLIQQTILMSSKYDVFVTNPPYAGNKYLTPEISSYLLKNYPDVKADLFSSFIEYSFHVTKEHGQIGFMTPFVWMFISSYEKLRKNIINNCTISSLIQLEYSGFDGATVPVCTYTLRNYKSELPGEYIRLSDFKGSKNQPIKALEAVRNPSVPYRFSFNQDKFKEIPNHIFVYWFNENIIDLFHANDLYNISISDGQTKTGNNDLYLRFLWEVDNTDIGKDKKWVIHAKGGPFRKWYGNIDTLVDWSEDARRHYREDHVARIAPEYIWFRNGITWTLISSGKFSVRLLEEDSTFNLAAPSIFFEDVEDTLYFIGLLNSVVHERIIRALNPTLNTNISDIRRVPYITENQDSKDKVKAIVSENISIAKEDWNSFENSINFKLHPFIINKKNTNIIKDSFLSWEDFLQKQFEKLKKNEELLNNHFIDLYGLTGQLNPVVDSEDINFRKANIDYDVKSFLSYAVGCFFGRYSLDKDGLIYAGGKFDTSLYKTFPADEDNIIPLLSGVYFEDDIVTKFVDFVRITFSEEMLEENLDFITEAIGRKKNETARESLRRYFLNDFYKDHVQLYKKRPIYWLFTSGKEKAFNCLIYMHRYDKTTLSRIRIDYVHEVQIRLDAEKKDLLDLIEGDSTTKEISNAKKELKSLDKKIDELKAYDELLHHMADMQIEIDLDDGVKVNYEKFKGLVVKI